MLQSEKSSVKERESSKASSPESSEEATSSSDEDSEVSSDSDDYEPHTPNFANEYEEKLYRVLDKNFGLTYEQKVKLALQRKEEAIKNPAEPFDPMGDIEKQLKERQKRREKRNIVDIDNNKMYKLIMRAGFSELQSDQPFLAIAIQSMENDMPEYVPMYDPGQKRAADRQLRGVTFLNEFGEEEEPEKVVFKITEGNLYLMINHKPENPSEKEKLENWSYVKDCEALRKKFKITDEEMWLGVPGEEDSITGRFKLDPNCSYPLILPSSNFFTYHWPREDEDSEEESSSEEEEDPYAGLNPLERRMKMLADSYLKSSK